MARDEVIWTCEGCEAKPTFDAAGFMKHAAEVHNTPEGALASQKMIMHGDGAKSYFTTYRWTFDGWTATQKIISQRTGQDAAFWEAMGGQ